MTLPGPPDAAGAAPSFLDRLGPRARLRAEPRFGVSVAGAGCALAVLGAVVIGLDGIGASAVDDSSSGGRMPGLVLSALVVAAGYLGLVRRPGGPLTTAAAAASALGLPPLVFFLTYDEGGFPPYSAEAVLLLSTAVWLATWALGPSRGHSFHLALGLLGAWLLVLQVVENVFDFPFLVLPALFSPDFEDALPDPTVVGVLSLGFGAGYVVLSRALDRRGAHGAATPALAAGLVALATGVMSLGDDLEQAGSGVLLLLLGVAVALHGADHSRRGATWIGAAGAALGVSLIVSDPVDDPTEVGILFLLAGLGLVVGAALAADTMSEPPEYAVEPAPDPLQSGGSTQPSAPPPGPAG